MRNCCLNSLLFLLNCFRLFSLTAKDFDYIIVAIYHLNTHLESEILLIVLEQLTHSVIIFIVLLFGLP